MKDSESMTGRRDFIRVGAGAAAAIGMLNAARAQAPSSQGVPWWAARPAKGGVAKPAAIDMHAHWSPEPYNKVLASLGQPLANPYPLDYDLDKRRQWMDDHGDLMHCLTLSGAMPWQRTSAQEGARLAQVINDTGIQIHLPDSLEKHDYLFDPGFAPVLARIEALNYPIIFHQLDGVVNAFGGTRTAGPPPLAAGIDAPIEHTFLASKFIYTGTLDKYPNLQIVLPHAGGAFPYLAGRVEHFLYHMTDHSTSIQRPFRDYLRRFHYDYLIYYPEALRFLMGLVGSDRIVVGTDNFAAKDIEYPSSVLDQFNLPTADRDRILKGNAMRLLHI